MKADATKAILISAKLKTEKGRENELEELESLCLTMGMKSALKMRLRLHSYNSSTFIGRGKIEEIKALINELGINSIVFDNEISPTQERNLHQLLNTPIVTRTKLILEIFSSRARTREGKLQVELANLSYNLSRLSGRGKFLSQQRGIIGARGPGEREIEYKRRIIQNKIVHLKNEIESIKKERAVQNKNRNAIPSPQVAIVGYTNTGKSTLLSRLTKGKHNIYADNKLFATLDPLTKRVDFQGGGTALFTDTVGFIQKLPHMLIAAFRATMEEILDSDLIIHLHDISSPQCMFQHETVENTLRELAEIKKKPLPEILNVFNKIDLAPNGKYLRKKFSGFNPVFISAATGKGIKELLRATKKRLQKRWKPRKLKIPLKQCNILHEIYKSSMDVRTRSFNKTVLVKFAATDENYARISSKLLSEI